MANGDIETAVTSRVWRTTAVLMAGLLLLAGCSGSGSAPPKPAEARPTSSGPDPSGNSATLPAGRPTPAVAAAATSFANPVFAENFPDPGILRVGALYYAYSTNSAASNVPVMSSPDLVTWTAQGDALPDLPEWATADDTWAPEVIQVGTLFVLYYTAADVATGTQCIGRAQARSPLGPFVDDSNDALVCQNEKGGSIDPSPFRAPDGSLHLLWKNDGNCCGYDVDIWSQPLSRDGLTLTGAPTIVLERNKAWQGKLIEGPEMSFHDGSYWLFYAANDYASARYAEGVARCSGPSGPCEDGSGPILTSTKRARGPGHAFVITTGGGEVWMAYHAWARGQIGGDQPGRQLWLSRVTWTANGPVVAAPSVARQRAPR